MIFDFRLWSVHMTHFHKQAHIWKEIKWIRSKTDEKKNYTNDLYALHILWSHIESIAT